MSTVRRRLEMPGWGSIDVEGPAAKVAEMERRLQGTGDQELRRSFESAERAATTATALEAAKLVDDAIGDGILAYESRGEWIKLAKADPPFVAGEFAKRREEDRVYRLDAAARMRIKPGDVL